MKINHTHHIAVNTKDINESIQFYQDIMGFRLHSQADMGDCVLVYMQVSEHTFIELFDLKGGCRDGETPEMQAGLKHIAFDVDDIFAWDKFLKEKGIPYVLEMTELHPIGKRVLLVADPNGVVVELCADL
jgi:catechol 2,3-dioxygenase-like lactoylglutathione lyase family enzyme